MSAKAKAGDKCPQCDGTGMECLCCACPLDECECGLDAEPCACALCEGRGYIDELMADMLNELEFEWPKIWPWYGQWWKPKDRRRDLIRAAALIVAEIERLDRAAKRDAA